MLNPFSCFSSPIPVFSILSQSFSISFPAFSSISFLHEYYFFHPFLCPFFRHIPVLFIFFSIFFFRLLVLSNSFQSPPVLSPSFQSFIAPSLSHFEPLLQSLASFAHSPHARNIKQGKRGRPRCSEAPESARHCPHTHTRSKRLGSGSLDASFSLPRIIPFPEAEKEGRREDKEED